MDEGFPFRVCESFHSYGFDDQNCGSCWFVCRIKKYLVLEFQCRTESIERSREQRAGPTNMIDCGWATSRLPRMLVLYFLFYVLPYVEATPICIDRAETRLESNPPLPRTLFGIVWSCLSTIIICAWTSVHPNVPPPNPWKARWNRLRLMFWMIIAPELVLAWAVRQFFAAREIRDEYNRRYPGA